MKLDFGELLIELRKARALTQYDLADLIGTTQRTISYYESEGGHPQAPRDGSPGAGFEYFD